MEQPLSSLSFRCHFEKCGPIRFISHLDLTRAFHRAFFRAQIPLKFSEGFSPHPKFAFALPLSVGTESVVELADFSLKAGFEIDPETLKNRLQEQMPTGIRIVKISVPENKFSDIAFASYRVLLPEIPKNVFDEAKTILENGVTIRKKNKKGKWTEKELSGGIQSVTPIPDGDCLAWNCTLSASGENYLKPELLLTALAEKMPQWNWSVHSILRTGIYQNDNTPF